MTYEFDLACIGTFARQHEDIAGNKQTAWDIGDSHTIAAAKLFANYIDNNNAIGCVNSLVSCVGGSTFDLNIYGSVASDTDLTPGITKRHDYVGILGMTYSITPALALTGALYYDGISNTALTAGSDGKYYTDVLLAKYALSERTQMYGMIDCNKVRNAALPKLSSDDNTTGVGKPNQTSVGVGTRHIF